MQFKLNKMTLMGKFLSPILLATTIAMILGAALLVNNVLNSTQIQQDIASKALKVEQESAEQSLIKALNSKADSLGLFMSKTAPDLILGYDFTSLQDFQAIAAKDQDVAYAAYLKPDNSAMTEFKAVKDKQDIIEKRYKIESEGELLGYVLLGLTKAGVKQGIHESNQRISQAETNVRETADEALSGFLTIMVGDVIAALIMISAMVYFLFKTMVTSRLRETNELIKALADGSGDLTRRLPMPNDDELSQLCGSVNQFVEYLQNIISNIVENTKVLNSEAGELQQYGSELSKYADSQSKETTMTATAMTEMTSTVQEVVRFAQDASAAANKADSDAHDGKKLVNETTESINQLAREIENASSAIHDVENDSENIGSVIEVIKGIADQTNLLALNAAIEAARAGEQGRGFAVVADEVRTLASRTQTSTEEIQQMIQNLQQRTGQAVSVMQQSTAKAKETVEQAGHAGAALTSITEAVSTINQMNIQIATAAEEQGKVSEEINKSIITLNNIAEHTSEKAQKTADSGSKISQIAIESDKLVGTFKI